MVPTGPSSTLAPTTDTPAATHSEQYHPTFSAWRRGATGARPLERISRLGCAAVFSSEVLNYSGDKGFFAAVFFRELAVQHFYMVVEYRGENEFFHCCVSEGLHIFSGVTIGTEEESKQKYSFTKRVF